MELVNKFVNYAKQEKYLTVNDKDVEITRNGKLIYISLVALLCLSIYLTTAVFFTIVSKTYK